MSFLDEIKAREEKNAAEVEAYNAMKPAEKKLYISKLYEGALTAYDKGVLNGRQGQKQGFAFLWIALDGKSVIDKAFRKKIKDRSKRPLFEDYRGSKNAWYFGSQSDLGFYDGLVSMEKYLRDNGISASQCDEWD